jgi:hypothetical protein
MQLPTKTNQQLFSLSHHLAAEAAYCCNLSECNSKLGHEMLIKNIHISFPKAVCSLRPASLYQLLKHCWMIITALQ